jgi:hypothetical protein
VYQFRHDSSALPARVPLRLNGRHVEPKQLDFQIVTSIHLVWHGQFAANGPDPDLMDAVAGAVPAATKKALSPERPAHDIDQTL